MVLLSKIYLLSNDWGNAIGAADLVLEVEKKNTKAIHIKAEAMFNVCQFEKALVHFYRGMVSSVWLYSKTSFGKIKFLQAYSTVKEQKNMFRLGVQKCKKIIYDCIPPDPEIFRGEGIEQLFKILHKVQEGRNFTEDELRMEE